MVQRHTTRMRIRRTDPKKSKWESNFYRHLLEKAGLSEEKDKAGLSEEKDKAG